MDRQRGGGRASPSTLTTHEHATQDPFPLYSINRELVLDSLSVHLTWNVDSSVLISFHPTLGHSTTKAEYLHDRILFAGQGVYWQNIFQASPDPTFVLLLFIWHVLYVWEEALQDLHTHICSLEYRVIKMYDIVICQELRINQAHLLHYYSLIEDIRKTVEFVHDTKNPAMDSIPDAIHNQSEKLMARECRNLLNEIERLEKGRSMQDQKLQNVMNLAFFSKNTNDSKQVQKMTEAGAKANALIQLIAYLTMAFLPASFVTAVFGMNISPFVPQSNSTLSHYFTVAIALIVSTAWVIVAFQSNIYPKETPLWKRFGWPVLLLMNWVAKTETD